jgi:hypothetical protein
VPNIRSSPTSAVPSRRAASSAPRAAPRSPGGRRAGWDASLKFERKVGQISFYDFLANQDITNDRENDANPNLVPPQSWELTGELGRNFGRWGKTRLKLYRHWVEDIVDHIPVGVDGDAVGNLPQCHAAGASRASARSSSTRSAGRGPSWTPISASSEAACAIR